jgi:hypothetical protein
MQQQLQQQQQGGHSSSGRSSSSDNDSGDDEPKVTRPTLTDMLSARRRQQLRGNGALTQQDVIQELEKITRAQQRTAELPSSSSNRQEPDRPPADDAAAAIQAFLTHRRLRLLQLLAWWPVLTSAQELLQQSVWGVIQSRIMLMGPDQETGPPVSQLGSVGNCNITQNAEFCLFVAHHGQYEATFGF